MELFKGIRLATGRRIVSRKQAKSQRSKTVHNLKSARKMGVVLDITLEGHFDIISKYYKKKQEEGIQVDVIGYVPEKEIPDKYMLVNYLSCLTRKDLNTWYIPVSIEAETFLRSPYHILIDANFGGFFPLKCITALSVADFKVGRTSEYETTPLDFMIDTGDQDLAYFLEQVDRYLEVINRPELSVNY